MNGLSYQAQKRIILLCFMSVPLALLALFTFYPAVKLVWMSFTDWDGLEANPTWIGFANFVEVFTNRDLFGVFLNQIPYAVVGIVQNAIAIVFAVILNSKLRGRNGFRVLMFLPFIMNAVAVAFMFQYVFDTTNGSLNILLGAIGLDGLAKTSWLGNTSLVNFSLASISMWRFLGYNMVIYLGALQSIPADMYEAAEIDGAGRWQKLVRLTLPNLTKIIQLNMFLTLSGALAVFDLPFVLTKGGPAGSSETFLFKTINTAFQFNNFGLASAMSVVLLLIVVVVLALQNLVIGRGGRDA
ncbi:carbohydrate ABC transporter membrane protein 1, CUT1 family (TC 3.A.1.1.-) [Cohnella sp. OV330]|uniref:carbohydrate ABC transporter permease n=1 Tax=Cohnella sp. OV330 TaxID=1855288 RepID=UPI0008EAE8FD|nr:sugar ABC transporter permease [Cohnella sp. OV330]SFA81358.1 carbohydrate ABC transporter membrane protein 1, CUT1 family (TC 3.A.1.1.-) [Cohnella sp. OV330]